MSKHEYMLQLKLFKMIAKLWMLLKEFILSILETFTLLQIY